MSLAQTAQAINEATPGWVNWLVIVGGAATAWMVPISAFVATAWGLLQIYGWFVNKNWRRKNVR